MSPARALAVGDLAAGRRSPSVTPTASPAPLAPAGTNGEGATRLSTLAPLPDLRGSSHRMRFDDNAACAVLFGQHHLNLARIEQKLPVSIVTRGNEVFIQGESEGEVAVAAAVLEDLYGQLKRGGMVGREEVDASLRMVLDGGRSGFAVGDEGAVRTERTAGHRRARRTRPPICARWSSTTWCSRSGPAGTGKTYLAVAMARGPAQAAPDRADHPVAAGGRGGRAAWASCRAT